MKIAVITGSPRTGATEGMADAFQAAAEKMGNEVVRFNATKLKVAGCRNCNACGKVAGRTCVFDDDFTSVAKAILEADGIVLDIIHSFHKVVLKENIFSKDFLINQLKLCCLIY